MRRLALILASLSLAVAAGAAPVAAGGPPSLAFYIDGARYRTIATPTDLSNTGAPESSFDRIYALGAPLANVAESKPGDQDFNGGRWAVYPVEWHRTPVQLMSAEEVLTAENAGWLTIAATPVRLFVCTVNQVPGG